MSKRPRPFTPEDLLGFSLLTDVQLAPDGETVVYAQRTIDAENDTYVSKLWLVPVQGGEPRQFTAGAGVDSSPRWSPDGRKIAFVSSRAGEPQLHVIDRDGGEARAVTSLKQGAMKAAWSPDGGSLLFVAQVEVVARPDTIPESRWDQRPRVITRASYKSDGAGYTLDSRMQIFVVAADGGDACQLTHGDADAMNPGWSPDGRSIVFVRKRTGAADSHRSDLWVMDADGGGPRQLTSELARVASPAWAPDGRTIAFEGSEREGDARSGLWVIDADGGAPRRLVGRDFELASYPLDNASPPFWTADGAALVVIQSHASTSRVVRVALDGGVEVLAGEDRQVTMLSVAPAVDRMVFACSDIRRFCEIWRVRLDGRDAAMITTPNAAWGADRTGFRVEHRTFKGPSGRASDGWLMIPEDEHVGPRPLWVDAHGGPHSHVTLGYPYHPYWHTLVSHGWVVLALNAIGSSSYGEQFSEHLRGRWGEEDLPEHLAAVDTLVAEGLVDDERVAIGGKSYGGFMAAWAIGHTRRFCAAVVSAPVANMVSHFGTSDSGYYVSPYAMGGEIDERRETYERLSPVRWLGAATTPTLILQGEDDQRCPIGQAEEVFATLVRAGRAPVEFIRYPGGDHHLAEQGTPSHRVDYTRRIVGWVRRWTRMQR